MLLKSKGKISFLQISLQPTRIRLTDLHIPQLGSEAGGYQDLVPLPHPLLPATWLWLAARKAPIPAEAPSIRLAWQQQSSPLLKPQVPDCGGSGVEPPPPNAAKDTALQTESGLWAMGCQPLACAIWLSHLAPHLSVACCGAGKEHNHIGPLGLYSQWEPKLFFLHLAKYGLLKYAYTYTSKMPLFFFSSLSVQPVIIW